MCTPKTDSVGRVPNTYLKGLSVLASIIINHLRGDQLHNRPGHRGTALMQTRQRRERYDYVPSKAHRGTKSNKFHLEQNHLPIQQKQHTPFANAVHQPTQYVGQQQTPPLQVPMSIQPFANAAHQHTQYVGQQQTPPLQVPMSVHPFANAAQQPTQYVGQQQTRSPQVCMSVQPPTNVAPVAPHQPDLQLITQAPPEYQQSRFSDQLPQVPTPILQQTSWTPTQDPHMLYQHTTAPYLLPPWA